MVRHQTNHRGVPPNCPACAIEKEFDRAIKMERKVLRVAKPRNTQRGNPGKGVSAVKFSGV
jgi:hypothetical protein